ncbi:hypothetical protein CBFG_01096 [Clostridiales bacterium 1_7_47FAA]|nr:hypothetical protein CBFG_01096 [Clostridiales bacterium 1_7_47FAA]
MNNGTSYFSPGRGKGKDLQLFCLRLKVFCIYLEILYMGHSAGTDAVTVEMSRKAPCKRNWAALD